MFLSTIDFNSLEVISASSRADVNARMNKSAIDDIPPPDIYLQTLPNRPDSNQNTTINHTILQLTNNDTSGFFSNSTFSA